MEASELFPDSELFLLSIFRLVNFSINLIKSFPLINTLLK